MKKILIISYYYPPNNNIPSWRPYSWASYFTDKSGQDVSVDVVTRYWTGKEQSWKELTSPSEGEHTHREKPSERLTVHYVATKKSLHKVIRFFSKFRFLSRIFNFAINRAGYHHIETDGYFAFKDYIKKTFSADHFDIVMVSSPPINLIRLGYDVRKHFKNALFIADFRDLWNTEELKISYQPRGKEKYHNTLYKKHLTKWLQRFDFVTGISQSLLDKVSTLNKRISSAVITNGFEKNLFEKLVKKNPESFVICSMGTVHPGQGYELLINGIIEFVKRNSFDDRIRIQFIGTKTFNPGLALLLESNLPASMLAVNDRIDRKQALQMMKDASVLVYPGWTGYRGIFPGKIFEYLATGNNILVAPGDKDVVEQLLAETKAGICKNSSADVTAQLQEWFDEWKVSGSITYYGLQNRIENYSRENQAKKMADIVGL